VTWISASKLHGVSLISKSGDLDLTPHPGVNPAVVFENTRLAEPHSEVGQATGDTDHLAGVKAAVVRCDAVRSSRLLEVPGDEVPHPDGHARRNELPPIERVPIRINADCHPSRAGRSAFGETAWKICISGSEGNHGEANDADRDQPAQHHDSSSATLGK